MNNNVHYSLRCLSGLGPRGWLWMLLLALAPWVAPVAEDAPPPALEFISYTSQGETGLELQLTLSGPPPQPASFTSTYPARITIDLPKVKNSLPWTLPLPIKQGGAAKSISAVEASGRTRVVVNLDNLVPYNTRIEGNSIFVSLTDVRAGGSAAEKPAAPEAKPAPKPEQKAEAKAEASPDLPALPEGAAKAIEPTANRLEDARFFALPGNRVQVKLSFSQPVPEAKSFTIDNPARIVFDFPGVANGLTWSTKEIGVGVARSIAAIEAGGRTRLVLNLDSLQPFDTQVEGNTMLVTLGGSRTAAAAAAPAAPAGTPGAGTAHKVEDIDFRRGETGEGRVVVRLSDPDVVVDTREEGGRIYIDLLSTSVPQELVQRLDVLDFATPVKYVESFAEGNKTRIVITPSGKYEHLAYQADNLLTVDVKPVKPAETKAEGPDAVYTGEKLSLNFQDIEVRAVLQLIADFTGLNLVASDTVQGNLTLRLKNVPWDQALDIILKSKGLDMRRKGNVILVAPGEEIAAREKLELEAKKQVADLSPLRSELIQINYAKAAEIAALLRGKEKEGSMLTERGRVSIDERTNTLLISDTPEKLLEVRQLVTKLDIPIRQVMIESRIVIATSDFARELGARFGVSAIRETNGDLLMNSGSFEATDTMAGSAVDNLSTTGSPFPISLPFGGAGPQRLNVNMPVTAANAGRIAFAILGKTTLLDLELSALQAEGRGEVISNPRVITSNQKEALIEQGTEIPYQQASSSGATNVTFKKAVLSLKVTPQITPDDRVLMDLVVNKDSVGEIFLGVPSIDTKEVNTQVLVDNGETVVLGGIYEQERSKEVDKVPFLGDLPIIGALFRNTRQVDDKTELLIFVTPKILKESLGL